MTSTIIILHDTDNVGTAVAELSAGDSIDLANSKVRVVETVPFAHKVSLKDLKAGETILKYGESIGRALVDIPAGMCVHTHNIESLRGRGDLGAEA